MDMGARLNEKQSTPRKGTETSMLWGGCMAFMETIYTPQGDGNYCRILSVCFMLTKQSTPRKGTETSCSARPKILAQETIYTPQGDGNASETPDEPVAEETIYTPQGDGNCALSMSLWLCVFETIYTPQGDGKPLIIRVAYTTARSTLRPVRGRKRKRNCFLEIEHTKTPQGDNFHQRSVMCFERSQRARLLWLPAARHR